MDTDGPTASLSVDDAQQQSSTTKPTAALKSVPATVAATKPKLLKAKRRLGSNSKVAFVGVGTSSSPAGNASKNKAASPTDMAPDKDNNKRRSVDDIFSQLLG